MVYHKVLPRRLPCSAFSAARRAYPAVCRWGCSGRLAIGTPPKKWTGSGWRDPSCGLPSAPACAGHRSAHAAPISPDLISCPVSRRRLSHSQPRACALHDQSHDYDFPQDQEVEWITVSGRAAGSRREPARYVRNPGAAPNEHMLEIRITVRSEQTRSPPPVRRMWPLTALPVRGRPRTCTLRRRRPFA